MATSFEPIVMLPVTSSVEPIVTAPVTASVFSSVTASWNVTAASTVPPSFTFRKFSPTHCRVAYIASIDSSAADDMPPPPLLPPWASIMRCIFSLLILIAILC